MIARLHLPIRLLKLKGSNLRRVHREHSDTATIRRASEYAKFEMSIYHTAQVT
jgi:hypothetical protein